MAVLTEEPGARQTEPIVDEHAKEQNEAGDGTSEHAEKEIGDEQADNAGKAACPVPLSPPEDCEAVTAHRGVLKKVLEPGEPHTVPSLHARCLVHYVGYLARNGDKFMDTRNDRDTDEPVVVVAGRKTAAQETGLCQAVATMCRGEKSLVFITDPAYGYGERGSFSFPCVPPDSALVYEVEMLGWESIEETDNDGNRGSLLYEERLERAERRRLTGNELFKAGQYKEALAKYAMALSYLDEDFMFQLAGHYLDKAEAVKVLVHLNMAATQLKTGDWNTAIYNCGQVLALDENNVKALFRRAKAQKELSRTEEARADLEKAIKLEPNNREVAEELRAVRAALKEEKKAADALWKSAMPKVIGPAPTAPAAAVSTSGGSAPAAAGAAEVGGSATADAALAASPASASAATQRSGGSTSTSGAAPTAGGAASSQPAKRAGAKSTDKGGKGGAATGAAGTGAAAQRSNASSAKQTLVAWFLALITAWFARLFGKAPRAGGSRGKAGKR
ncbi:hypothetical protein HYH02_014296 [Chlamydomonas schloesseri]|uniref:peptidylprolyl isomerase n=1 Tax=Chlamydomonas schloesseri TaxID=2026947 RepID=A0A835VWY1_9CHLO|nr:hypothetical protein HYH02_014296 [Chlamydomonas schloesseri]|eukprot:KAG2428594.1 hypothetical protein HYH02_014296 [Chlamydomonas schloesseri]